MEGNKADGLDAPVQGVGHHRLLVQREQIELRILGDIIECGIHDAHQISTVIVDKDRELLVKQ